MATLRGLPSDSGFLLWAVNKIGLVLVTGLGLWLTGVAPWLAPGWVLGGYGVLTLTVAVLRRWHVQRRTVWDGLGYGVDLGLVAWLLYVTGGLASPFWPLLGLQALFPVFYVSRPELIVLGAFAGGPLYALVLARHGGHFAFLTDSVFLARYLVLFVLALIATVAAESLHRLRRRQAELVETLARREMELDSQTRRLQRTAADLGDRVLQLRALQEMARGLATTLDLPETLQVLVERLAALAEARCAAVALLDDDGETLRGVAAATADGALRDFRFDVPMTADDIRLLAAGHIVAAASEDVLGLASLRALWGLEHILCLPLVLRNRPLGALYLADDRPDFDTERRRQWLDSFSYFAAAAVENARLYRAVADKSRELEAILAGIGDGVLVVDADLQLVLMNPVAATIFDLEAPPVGLPLRGLIAHADLLSLLEAVVAAPDRPQVREIAVGSPPRGAVYQALAAPLVVDDTLVGIATVLRDITTQKELERMKSNFLSVVSHELKTPLHSIKGFVDIILMGKTGPVSAIQRDFLETVKQQTDHLQRMIDDLLEFSRLESGRVTLRLQPVDLPVVVEAVVEKLTPLAASAEVALINLVPEDLPTIAADPWRLEQVVTNLVDNAIKFTPAQGRVTIRARDTGDFIEVSVEDTGIGIPADQLERVFERFYQVDGGVNRLYKGTGLGLTICRHLVEHHGGRIWATSELGRGTTFTFTISRHLQPTEGAALDFTTFAVEP
ncbi:MAG: ATP-binding protein [Caldilineales bacterium]|nr:ATP-binding protein [Caldilineales bacterium]